MIQDHLSLPNGRKLIERIFSYHPIGDEMARNTKTKAHEDQIKIKILFRSVCVKSFSNGGLELHRKDMVNNAIEMLQICIA
ncbi:hypothetical protein BLOT_014619 [Blomia tropicalis]|nr:hypothetical protein BLOT_014619 [Blomia tropicalis]